MLTWDPDVAGGREMQDVIGEAIRQQPGSPRDPALCDVRISVVSEAG